VDTVKSALPSDDAQHPAEFERHWRLVTLAGTLGMVCFACIGSAPRTKFLLEMGATPFDFGLLSSLAAGALVFQIVAGVWTHRLPRRKPVWMALAIAQRLVFLGVLAAPTLFHGDRVRIGWIVAVIFLHSALGNVGDPLWFAWMSDLIPRETLNRHWASRQRFIAAFGIVTQLGIAFGFRHFEVTHRVVLGFSLLTFVGVFLGVVDILLFSWVPETQPQPRQPVSLRATLAEPLANREFRPYLWFRAYHSFAVMVAAPFFGVYLISELKMSVLAVQLLSAVSAIGIVLSSRLWGMLCDTYGQRPVLQLTVAAKPLVPFAYLVIPATGPVTATAFALLWLIDGITNAGLQLGTQGVMLKHTPRSNRTMYIAVTNVLALGVAGGIAPLVAGGVIEPLTKAFSFALGPYRFTGYHAVFLGSMLLRMGGWAFVARFQEGGSLSVGAMLAYLLRANPLAVLWATSRLHASRDERLRAWAASWLGRLQSPLAVHDLVRALTDPSERVRLLAADALGRIGASEASIPLGRALCDSDARVQSRAARALGRIGGTESLRVLLQNLTRLDARALEERVRSLGRIGDDAAMLPLIFLFNEVTDPGLRQEIASALGRIAQTDSVSDVLAVLSHQSAWRGNASPPS